MKNVHMREMKAPIERARRWIEASWSATSNDPFPRDVLPSWRKNPPGVDPLALVPNVTRVGHGSISFRFASWDGECWRAKFENGDFPGWQGFDLEATPGGCRITHTIDFAPSAKGRLLWTAFIETLHDWCLEAMLDRIEEALETGEMPAITRRPKPMPVAFGFAALRQAGRLRPRRQPEAAARVSSA